MQKYGCVLFVFVLCVGIFCPVTGSAESISSLTQIVYIKADAGTWDIRIYNHSTNALNGVNVQASQSIYTPAQASAFNNDLSPASGFNMNLPAKGATGQKIAWNRRSGAKTLKFTITWQGSTRIAYLDLTKQYFCKPSDVRHPNVPLFIESINISTPTLSGYTNRVIIVFNNPTSNQIATRITPWQRGPNGDKIPVMSYQNNLYPERTTQVAYHFNSIEGTEEFGVMYGRAYGPQGDVSEKVICKNSGPIKMQQKLRLKTPPGKIQRK